MASAANRLERISNLSVEEFISEYLQKNRPVIVTGAMVHWKALETWNPDALASRFGNERVQVYGDLFRLAAITTLAEYLKKYFGCSSSSPGSVPYVRWYCHLANDERVPWADEVFAKVRSVDLEEEDEKFPVRDPLGVEDDLDSLCVPGMVLVGRVVVLPTGVSDPGGDDSFAVAQ